jgi:hypothetical protein
MTSNHTDRFICSVKVRPDACARDARGGCPWLCTDRSLSQWFEISKHLRTSASLCLKYRLCTQPIGTETQVHRVASARARETVHI